MRKQGKGGLAELVSRVIREKELKLRDVASKSDGKIAQSYVSRIISGDVTNLSTDKLVALSRGLDIDPYELFSAATGLPKLSPSRKPKDKVELGAIEFVEIMRKVVGNIRLSELVEEATQLWPEEYPIVLTYLTHLNERKQKSKGKKLLNDKATT
jgi:transcriptional regulator with XRE-family HTH domain